jgi:hypothetical protein
MVVQINGEINMEIFGLICKIALYILGCGVCIIALAKITLSTKRNQKIANLEDVLFVKFISLLRFNIFVVLGIVFWFFIVLPIFCVLGILNISLIFIRWCFLKTNTLKKGVDHEHY